MAIPQSIKIVVVAGLLCVALYQVPVVRTQSNIAREEIILTAAPSAERAYRYGESHFDAAHPAAYNINRAAVLFQRAYELDAQHPIVQHQLARIAFLEGDFVRALTHINLQLERDNNPSSYYVRGLIKGYMDDFDGAAADFEEFLTHDPKSWAGTNDYAWVLIKAGRADDAHHAIEKVLNGNRENPWLMNTYATALFEIGEIERARVAAAQAVRAVMKLDAAQWSRSNPGNDPLIANEGILAFQTAVVKNMHTIMLASEKQSEGVR